MRDVVWKFVAVRAAGVVAAGIGLAAPVWADQVIAEDLIVQASMCVGFDCVVNENFSSDTIKLKENNLRILFDDTSLGNFPANDWRIVVNDQLNGGRSYFAIEDVTAGTTLFRLCAVADATCTNIMPATLDPQTAQNTTDIAQNTTAIATNTTDIAQNTTAIATNTTDIAQNTTAIATNATYIAQNTTAIATNTSDIAAINAQIRGFADDISTNREGVAMAIALGGIAPLMPDQNGTLAINVGHFNGATALGIAGGFRLDDNWVLNAGVGYAADSRTVGGRLGMQYSW